MENDSKRIAAALARACETEGQVQMAKVLNSAAVDIAQVGYDNWDGGTDLYECSLEVAPELYGALGEDREGLERQILARMQPISRRYPGKYLTSVIIVPSLDDGTSDKPVVSDQSELRRLIEEQKQLMVAVATGGPRINDVNAAYKDRRASIRRQLTDIGTEEPNPYADLWEWYNRWSSGDLPTYASRRQFVMDIYRPLLDAMDALPAGSRNRIVVRPTGWVRVDRAIGEARSQLAAAVHEEQYQQVGMLCREALISLAQAVYDPERHPVEGDTEVSKTDAKRMLTAFFNVELAGGANKEQRKHAHAALDVANKTTHDRAADFRRAALCEEATTSVINTVAIICGRRDPEGSAF